MDDPSVEVNNPEKLHGGVLKKYLSIGLLLALGLIMMGAMKRSTSVALLDTRALNHVNALAEAVVPGNHSLADVDYDMYLSQLQFARNNCEQFREEKVKSSYGCLEDGDTNSTNILFCSLNVFFAKVPERAIDGLLLLYNLSYNLGMLIGLFLPFLLHFGPVKSIGLGVLLQGIMQLFAPLLLHPGIPSHMHAVAVYGLLVRQVCLGVGEGMIWPALATTLSTYCEKRHLSLFASSFALIYVGEAVIELTGPVTLHLSGNGPFFLVQTLLVLLWFCVLSTFVKSKVTNEYSTVSDMTSAEFEKVSPATLCHLPSLEIPWRKILKSGPVWSIFVVMFAYSFGETVLLHASTRYLQLVHGYQAKPNFILYFLPLVLLFIFAMICGACADQLILSGRASATTTRKIFVYFGMFYPAGLLFVKVYTGCHATPPAILYIGGVTLLGATMAGAHASALEISPNFAGAVVSLMYTAGTIGRTVSFLLVFKTIHGNIPGMWHVMFGVTPGLLVVCASMFMMYGSSTRQPWDLITPRFRVCLSDTLVIASMMENYPHLLWFRRFKRQDPSNNIGNQESSVISSGTTNNPAADLASNTVNNSSDLKENPGDVQCVTLNPTHHSAPTCTTPALDSSTTPHSTPVTKEVDAHIPL